MNTKVIVAHTIEELSLYHQEWLKLVSNAVETNAFFEPWMLLPAMRHLSPSRCVMVVLVFDVDTGRLIGLFPLVPVSRYRSLPIKTLECWKHTHSASATPLVEKGVESFCLRAFLSWFDKSYGRFSWVRFRMFAGNSVLSEELKKLALFESRKIDEQSIHERAFLESSLSSKDYFKQFLSKKHVKEHRRQWNRLSDKGELSYVQFNENEYDLMTWLEDFLALEQAGWKGRAGTSINDEKNEKIFFIEMVQEAVKNKRISMSRLELDGATIAGECSFLSGKGGGMLKIVYDEEYAVFSPGVLLTMKKTETILDKENYDYFDSYAIPNHPMINKLWKQDLRVCDFSISSTHITSKFMLSIIKMMVLFKHKLVGVSVR